MTRLLQFQCGKNTETVEYAVCYAVNMKTDSVAFMAGELEKHRQGHASGRRHGVGNILIRTTICKPRQSRAIHCICTCHIRIGTGIPLCKATGMRSDDRVYSRIPQPYDNRNEYRQL